MMRRQLTALVALVTTACSGWRVETWERAGVQKDEQGRDLAVKVTLKTGEDIYLLGPRVVGDSVIGYSRDGQPDFVRRAVPTKDVQSMSTYGPDQAKTVAAIFAISAATLALAYACVSSLESGWK